MKVPACEQCEERPRVGESALCEECGDFEEDSMSRSDLPWFERLWLLLSASLAAVELRSRIEEGRFESVEHYFEVKRKMGGRR